MLLTPLVRDALTKEGRDFDQELVDSQRYADATRVAVGKELPLLYPYLACEEMRRCIAAALKNYPERVVETLPLLEKALLPESDEEVREVVEETIAVLKDKENS